MQLLKSIKNFLKPSWIKLAIMIGLPIIMTLLSSFDTTKILQTLFYYALVWPAELIKVESLICFLIIIIHWYLLACLIIFISRKTGIGKKIMIAITIIVVGFCLYTTIFIPKPTNYILFDARITADMNQIRNEAVFIEDKTGNYDNICENQDMIALITAINDYAPTPASCFAEKDAYCVTVELNSGDFYCVDSALRSISTTTISCTEKNKSCK